jgi:vacuolar-type H+-ATPase subunit F/Vma7
MLLAGIGHVTPAPNTSKNFLVVDNKTETAEIEKAFDEFTSRKDIGILLINQHVCPTPQKNPAAGQGFDADTDCGEDSVSH